MTLDAKNRTLKACLVTATLLLAGALASAPGAAVVDLVPAEDPQCLLFGTHVDVCLTPIGPGTPFEVVPEDVEPDFGDRILVVGSVRIEHFAGGGVPAVGVGEDDPCEVYAPLSGFVSCTKTNLLPEFEVREVDAIVDFGAICISPARLSVFVLGEEQFFQEPVPSVHRC